MKIIFFVETEKNIRALRISEEAKKEGIDVQLVNSYTCLFKEKEIVLVDNNFLKVNFNDVFWLASNAIVNQNALRFLKKFNNFSWPNYQSIDFANKYFGNCFFSSIGVPTPSTCLINSLENKIVKKIVEHCGDFPLIIKNNQGSLGQFVAKVKNKQEIEKFILEIMEGKNLSERLPFRSCSFLLQEFIAESAGMDYRVLCLEDKIIGGIKRTSQNGDFRANISLGGKAEAFDIPKDLAVMCRKIMRKGKLFYAGLDFIKSERGWLAIEVNTSAQFAGFEKATGINVAKMIVKKLIEKKSSLKYNSK